MRDILYTVWSTFGVSESHENLTRDEVVLRYGETTVAAMEVMIVIYPGRAAGLRGVTDEFTVRFEP